jgi:hypothetical protein
MNNPASATSVIAASDRKGDNRHVQRNSIRSDTTHGVDDGHLFWRDCRCGGTPQGQPQPPSHSRAAIRAEPYVAEGPQAAEYLRHVPAADEPDAFAALDRPVPIPFAPVSEIGALRRTSPSPAQSRPGVLLERRRVPHTDLPAVGSAVQSPALRSARIPRCVRWFPVPARSRFRGVPRVPNPVRPLRDEIRQDVYPGTLVLPLLIRRSHRFTTATERLRRNRIT